MEQRSTKFLGVASVESTVRKKMAAVHFTTIPFETNTTNRHIKGHNFVHKFVPVLATLCMLSLKFLELFFAFL